MLRPQIIIALCLLAFCSQAQFNETRMVIGVEAGPSQGLYDGEFDGDELTSKHVGFGLGISLEIGITPNMYLKTGFIYEAKGPGFRVALLNEDMEITGYTDSWVRHSYTVVPLMLNYRFGGKISGTISAGGYYAGLIGVRQLIDASASTPEYSFDITEEYQSYDFGFAGGVGLEVPVTPLIWASGEMRAHYGLTHLLEEAPNEGERLTLSSTLFLVGFKYLVGKRGTSIHEHSLR